MASMLLVFHVALNAVQSLLMVFAIFAHANIACDVTSSTVANYFELYEPGVILRNCSFHVGLNVGHFKIERCF
jgi:hypothetical protein